MEFHRAGIGAVLCVLGNGISEETADRVAALDRAVRTRMPQGVTGTVPSYTSLLVTYDPLRTGYRAVVHALRMLAKGGESGKPVPGRLFELPVCYGGSFGPDLARVAGHAGLSGEEVVRLHSGREYRIYMLGFLPGFPYLGGMEERLATPRLERPRVRIPAGSVGIGGSQTGVYPIDSPGGWQLIGRTPLRLFDPVRPLPWKAGDRIRFRPVSEEEYLETEGSECLFL